MKNVLLFTVLFFSVLKTFSQEENRVTVENFIEDISTIKKTKDPKVIEEYIAKSI